MKICKDCHVAKDESDFYRNQNDCKECFKAKVRKNRNETKRDYYLAYDKQRAKTLKRKTYRKKALIEERRKHPLARKARNAVAYALRVGKLTKQPCHCGELKVEAHHPDYEQPLFVIWLCNRHHKHIHDRTAL